nr:hypothetical protein [Angustibacter aerolatus]
MLFALYPVGVYTAARRWLGPRTALLSTCLLFMTSSIAGQMPALARQEVALLLFLGIVLVALDRSLRRRGAQGLVLVLGCAMVVSHYSTTYVAVGAFLGARVIAFALRVMRRRSAHRPVLSLPVVLLLAAATFGWNGPVTHSTDNVTGFASSIAAHGFQVLPNGGGGSIVTKWLAGNVAASSTPREYFDSVAQTYREQHPWLSEHVFSPSAQRDFPATASEPPSARPWQPGLKTPLALLTTQVRQAGNLGVIAGAVGLLLLLRRRRADAEPGRAGDLRRRHHGDHAGQRLGVVRLQPRAPGVPDDDDPGGAPRHHHRLGARAAAAGRAVRRAPPVRRPPRHPGPAGRRAARGRHRPGLPRRVGAGQPRRRRQPARQPVARRRVRRAVRHHRPGSHRGALGGHPHPRRRDRVRRPVRRADAAVQRAARPPRRLPRPGARHARRPRAGLRQQQQRARRPRPGHDARQPGSPRRTSSRRRSWTSTRPWCSTPDQRGSTHDEPPGHRRHHQQARALARRDARRAARPRVAHPQGRRGRRRLGRRARRA